MCYKTFKQGLNIFKSFPNLIELCELQVFIKMKYNLNNYIAMCNTKIIKIYSFNNKNFSYFKFI